MTPDWCCWLFRLSEAWQGRFFLILALNRFATPAQIAKTCRIGIQPNSVFEPRRVSGRVCCGGDPWPSGHRLTKKTGWASSRSTKSPRVGATDLISIPE